STSRRTTAAAVRPLWSSVTDQRLVQFEKEAAMADDPATEPTTEPAATAEPSSKPDETQLGDAGKKALDEERKARRDAEARLKELEPLAKKAKELEDAQKSESEKLNEKLTLAEGKARESETAALRLEIALDKAP